MKSTNLSVLGAQQRATMVAGAMRILGGQHREEDAEWLGDRAMECVDELMKVVAEILPAPDEMADMSYEDLVARIGRLVSFATDRTGTAFLAGAACAMHGRGLADRNWKRYRTERPARG